MSSPAGEIELPHDANDPYTKKVALSVAIYAVIIAVAGVGGKNAGKEMLKEQIAASDLQISAANEWSRYQAKTVREAITLNDLDKNETELSREGLAAETRARLEKSAGRMKAKAEGYTRDKEGIAAQARKIEEERKEAQRRSRLAHTKDGYFDIAELLLQISIVLASVAMLSRARWPYLASLGVVAVGSLLTFNGYALMFHVGFIEGGGH